MPFNNYPLPLFHSLPPFTEYLDSLSLCPSASWHSTLSLIAHNWVGGTVGRPRLCVQRASGQVNGALVVNRELSPSTGTEGGDNGPLSNLKRQSWVPFYPSSSPLSLFHRLTDRISCIATLQLSFSWLSEHGKWRGLEWQSMWIEAHVRPSASKGTLQDIQSGPKVRPPVKMLLFCIFSNLGSFTQK